MAFLILLAAVCAATVFITLGSWSRLVRTPLRSRWLLVPALGIPIALRLIDLPANRVGTIGFGCYLTAYGLLLTFCFLNLSVRGMAVVAVGVALNAIVIGLNHGMPTEAVDGKKVEATALHKPRASNDLLPILGDVIVMPVTRETVSFGDLIIAVGLINVVFWASRPKKRVTISDTAVDEPEVASPPPVAADTWLADEPTGAVTAAQAGADDPDPTTETAVINADLVEVDEAPELAEAEPALAGPAAELPAPDEHAARD